MSGCGSRTLNISSSLPFLRICKQIHSENAAVLYGGMYKLPIFRFSIWLARHVLGAKEGTVPLEQHLHAGLETNSQIQKPDTNSGILGHAFFLNDEDYSTEKFRILALTPINPVCDFATM